MQGCNIERSFLIGVFLTVKLVTTNCSSEHVVVVHLQANGVSVFTHGCTTVITKTAIFLDNIFEKIGRVIRSITTFRVNVGDYIQGTINDDNTFTMQGSICVVKCNTFIFFKVFLEVNGHGRNVKNVTAFHLCNAHSTFVIRSYINIVIVTSNIMGVYCTTGVTYCTVLPVTLCIKGITVLQVGSTVVILTNV